MQKILIFSLSYFPKHVGGAEVAIREITDRIPDIEFHLVANRYDSTLPREEKIGNVVVHRIGLATKEPSMADLKRFPLMLNKPLYQFLAAWHALSLHRTHQFDCVWAMMAHATGVPAAIFKLRHPKVPYLLTLQEGDPPEYIERTMRPLWPLFSRAFTSADMVQTISNFLGRWARTRGFAGTLEVIPNAVNTRHFSQQFSPEELQKERERLGKHAGDVYLVTTSRLVHKNAIDDCVRAMPLLPKHVHFIVFGTGPDETMLKRLAAELGVTERVHMLGQVSHQDMALALHACDIFIRPSRSEGMGNSFVEAMAAGLPVIATQEGGIADFLFDAKRNPGEMATGWAVDKDSPAQIAKVVEEILAHPERTRQTAERARKMVFEKYDWDLIAEQMRERVFGRLFR